MASEKLLGTGDGVTVGRAGERRAFLAQVGPGPPAPSLASGMFCPFAQRTAQNFPGHGGGFLLVVSSVRQKQRPQESGGALHGSQVAVEGCSPPRPPPSSVKHPGPPWKAGEPEGKRRAPGEAPGESVCSLWIPQT